MNGGPSGFNNAPITKAFVIASALFTVFLGIQGRSSKLGLSYQDIFEKFRIWKLITSIFAFSSTPELMFGLFLLYYFRVFERQIGSNKYSVFISFSMIVSLLLEILLLWLLKGVNAAITGEVSVSLDFFVIVVRKELREQYKEFLDPSANLLTSGPYGLIFASFVPFFFDIPVSTRFRVFSVHFSDKSFIYLAGLQLLVSSWKRSILPGICGILAGSLYRLNILGIRKAKFPELVVSFFSRLSLPSIGSPSAAPGRNAVRSVSPNSGRLAERSHPAPIAASVEPSEESIGTLVSMGFDRDAARQALVHARNDINVATNILLEAQSH